MTVVAQMSFYPYFGNSFKNFFNILSENLDFLAKHLQFFHLMLNAKYSKTGFGCGQMKVKILEVKGLDNIKTKKIICLEMS